MNKATDNAIKMAYEFFQTGETDGFDTVAQASRALLKAIAVCKKMKDEDSRAAYVVSMLEGLNDTEVDPLDLDVTYCIVVGDTVVYYIKKGHPGDGMHAKLGEGVDDDDRASRFYDHDTIPMQSIDRYGEIWLAYEESEDYDPETDPGAQVGEHEHAPSGLSVDLALEIQQQLEEQGEEVER